MFLQRKVKKGILPMEALIGIIVSVLALVFLFQILAWYLFDGETNLSIAMQNADSIVEFKQFSEDKYSNLNNCFTMLKLSNLENYQIENNEGDDNYYFYVITKEGVGVYNLLDLPTLKDDFSQLSNLRRYYFVEFDTETKLLRENIDSKFWEAFEYIIKEVSILQFYYSSDYNNFNEFDNTIDLPNNEYIILRPKFNLELFDFEIWGTDDNQKILVSYDESNFGSFSWIDTPLDTINRELYYDSFYLGYETKNSLFNIYTVDSFQKIESNLCQYQQYANLEFTSRFTSDQILKDYLLYDFSYFIKDTTTDTVIVELILKDIDQKESFTCNSNQRYQYLCDNLERQDITKLNVREKLLEIFKKNQEFTSLTYDEGKIPKKDIISQFLNKELKVNGDKIIEDDFKTIDWFWSNYDAKFDFFEGEGDIIPFSIDDPLNNCNKIMCEYFLYNKNNGNVYFYDENKEDFFDLNVYYFERETINRGDSYNLYLFGEKVDNFKIETFDIENDVLNDYKFYRFSFNLETQNYEALISPSQLRRMREYKEEEK